VTVLHTSDGTTVEYDVSEWTRFCRHPGSGSPVVCPDLQRPMNAWLGGQGLRDR